MYIIGITGGIGSGKSEVTKFLKSKGYKIIDADEISREMTRSNKDCLSAIATSFGREVFFSDGSLNRTKLGKIIFSSKEKRLLLEDIVTKPVIKEIKDKIAFYRENLNEEVVFLDAPLLLEMNLDKYVDIVWLIAADDSLRIKRVCSRDGLTIEAVKQRIENQMSTEEKRKGAHLVIDNNGTIDELYSNVLKSLEKINVKEAK